MTEDSWGWPRTDVRSTQPDDGASVGSESSGNGPAFGLEGRWIDQYLVKRQLGEGAMGRVYLARDRVLGRRVALKILKADPSSLQNTKQLMEEARAVARFSHPNIVSIYGVGDFDGTPYLAMEYLDGDSLRERLKRGPFAPMEVVRIACALARALAAAHSANLIHGDLKPENVVIPSDGRPRVVDFGLAQDPRRAENGLSGTLGYIAPERCFGSPPTAASDVWSLGVVIYELLDGQRPYVDMSLPELWQRARQSLLVAPLPRTACPSALTEVVVRCLAAGTTERPSAQQVAERLEPILHASRTTDEDVVFRGLASFEERDAAIFYGREAETNAAVERLRTCPILTLVGPSGSGKSSLVQAGIIPTLRERDRWIVLQCRPGPTPLRALARRLAAVANASSDPEASTVEQTYAELLDTPVALNDRLTRLANEHRAKVLVFVDQLEEIFANECDYATRSRFLETLAIAAEDPDGPTRLVLCIREDFLGQLVDSDHVDRIFQAITPLRPLAAEQIVSIMSDPVRLAGYSYDQPERVPEIAREVASLAAPLPVIQFALMALWDRRHRESRTLPISSLDPVGGLAGALADHAESVVRVLQPVELANARMLLLRLIGTRGARVNRLRSEVLTGLPPSAEQVLERLVAARLVVAPARRETDGAPVVELAHEALVVAWPRLSRWAAEVHEGALVREEIDQAAELWNRRGRRRDQTLTGETLVEIQTTARRLAIDLSPLARDFVDASDVEDRRRRRRRTALWATALAALTTVAMGGFAAAITFSQKEREAVAQRNEINAAVADIGRFVLRIQPFDWDASRVQTVDVPSTKLPSLSWRLHARDIHDPRQPGLPLLPEQARQVSVTTATTGELVALVEARGGPAFLEVSGRGGQTEDCASSWIALESLPGYAQRSATPAVIQILVPTCQATWSGMVTIARGDFVLRTEAGSAAMGDTLATEQIATLPDYAIDMTEVSNAAYSVYARMATITGASMPKYPSGDLYRSSSLPSSPLAGLTAYDADAYCAYMGKRLPTIEEWVKAARGGVALDDVGKVKNPLPRRRYVWGERRLTRAANLDGAEDGHIGVSSIGTMDVDRSPYGVRDLAGNMLEWTSSPANGAAYAHLRAIRGGSWLSPRSLDHDAIDLENARDPRFPDYTVGLRCAMSLRHEP